MISILVAIGLGVPALIFTLRNGGAEPSLRELTLSVTSESILSKQLGVSSPKLTILFSNQPVQDLLIANMLVKNTGDEAVRREDFEENLAFEVRNGRVIEAQVIDAQPLTRRGAFQSALTVDDQGHLQVTPISIQRGESASVVIFGELVTTTPRDVRPEEAILGELFDQLGPYLRLVNGRIVDFTIRFDPAPIAFASGTSVTQREQREQTLEVIAAAIASGLASVTGAITFVTWYRSRTLHRP